MPLNLPRPIRPELVEVGDRIRVTFPKARGVVMTHEGVVHHRADSGDVRYLYTEEGATLIAWEVGKHNLSIMLVARPDVHQTPMFGLDAIIERTL